MTGAAPQADRFGNLLPFSPVPAHPVDMLWEPGDTWSHVDTPLMVMHRKACRDAVVDVAFAVDGDLDRLREAARNALDFERAFLGRQHADWLAGRS